MPFDITQCSNAYFSENNASCKLRNKIKKNPININNEDFNIIKNNFVSNTNINYINNYLVNITKNEMNVRIPLQKPIEIYVFAEYIFDNYSLNLNFDYNKQLDYLNQKLIEYVKPILFNKIKEKINYIKNLENKNRCLLPLPISVGKITKYNESFSNKIIFNKF